MILKFIHQRKTIMEYTVESLDNSEVPKKGDIISIKGEDMKIVGVSLFDKVVAYRIELCEI